MSATRNHHGLIHRTLEPGAFYRCASVGEFCDPSCNVIVPGCTAVVDERLRVITELRLPDRPVQIPTHKMVIKDVKHREDPTEWIEQTFDVYDSMGVGEGLQQASDTGLILAISDEEMAELWPDVWATRREKIVFDLRELRTGSAEPMLDLITKAKQDRLADARTATKQIHDEAKNAAK